MKGKIVLITGATSGIGRETAIGLAKMGATVVFTTRSLQKGELAKNEIIHKSNNDKVSFIYCDLASFDSIRSFCIEFKAKYPKLHVLINNAGVWNYKRRESKDGIEETFAVNYLAPFLITNLLIDALKKGAPSRIINVASRLHTGKINFDDIEFRKSYSGRQAYAQSKLALILFTRILAKKLKGTGITANCVHPGFVATNLGRNGGVVARNFFKMFGKSPKKGAETSIYLASSSYVREITGEYFADKKIVRTSSESYNINTAKRLWNLGAKYAKEANIKR